MCDGLAGLGAKRPFLSSRVLHFERVTSTRQGFVCIAPRYICLYIISKLTNTLSLSLSRFHTHTHTHTHSHTLTHTHTCSLTHSLTYRTSDERFLSPFLATFLLMYVAALLAMLPCLLHLSDCAGYGQRITNKHEIYVSKRLDAGSFISECPSLSMPINLHKCQKRPIMEVKET